LANSPEFFCEVLAIVFRSDKDIAAGYHKKADALEEKGYHRFATAIRELAKGYEQDAERESRRDPFED
jgi:hypothetical protein